MKKNGKKNETSDNDLIVEIEKKFERHTSILMEKMDSNVKTVTEQYSGLAKQVSELKSDVKDLKNDMAIVKPALERNCKDVQGLKQDMVEVKNDLQELKKDMCEVKSELGSVKMVVVNISHEIKDHDTRIKKVEEKVIA